MDRNKRFWCLEEYEGETSPIVDGKFAPTNLWLCNKLNELYEENQQLRELLEYGLEVSQCEIDEELRRRKND